VLLDYRLPDSDGLTCIREIRRLRADVPGVTVTGTDRIPSASRP
jgi:CheY-like chemotaxis protein